MHSCCWGTNGVRVVTEHLIVETVWIDWLMAWIGSINGLAPDGFP